VRTFKAILLIMGDSEVSGGGPSPMKKKAPVNVLEEERWLIAQGILHGEMRDEIYCQVVKQLNYCPSL
jgi:Rho GTPase-activating protein 39